jgi:hypothetical protein
MRPERAALAAVDEVFEVWREERTVEATVPVREVVAIFKLLRLALALAWGWKG